MKRFLALVNGNADSKSLFFVDVLADFIREIGLPTTFAEMNIPDDTDYKAIVDSTVLTGGCAKKFTRKELLEVLLECR